jgi:WD repeat-containing protein 44
MPYFSDLNTYLHQSSLLIQAYPSTRITTRYSLPRKPNPNSKSKPKPTPPPATDSTADPSQPTVKREPSATLTLKTFHPESGICLKYKTDKAAEVGRLMTGLGRLAKGEIIEMPSVPAAAAEADRMDVDSGEGTSTPRPEAGQTAVQQQGAQQSAQQGAQGAGGKKKKKKGGKN